MQMRGGHEMKQNPRGHFKSGEPYFEHAAEKREREAKAFKPRVRCGVCHHHERVRIEALRTAGVSLDKLAEQFGFHRDAIWRHCENHVSDEAKVGYLLGPAKIADLANAAADESRTVLDYLTITRSIVMNALDRSAQANKPYEVDRLSGRMIETMREIGRITGEVRDFAATTINIQNNTQILNSQPFMELQTGLLKVCARHPEARADIISLFHDLDARHSSNDAKTIQAKALKAAEVIPATTMADDVRRQSAATAAVLSEVCGDV
ncbi:hypothetical protein [Methylocapsa palsarum]|uniref:Uncharacterized protein n=1 Tax=Methylocapsa palsarum TaxID=1612308 RepID=A0A1I3YC61_9HYPH|nr:hypothetical protein [Methylocapsa palsarum]SFK28786.1 hypothetical protein SAMN05444581_105121 [Methylocapsa palsarum]